MNHETFEELLAGYALNILEGEELASLENHLQSGCDQCRRQLDQLQSTTALLAYGIPAKNPPAELKERLMRKVRSTAGADMQPRIGEFSPRPTPGWRSWVAIAAVVLVAVIGVTLFPRHARHPAVEPVSVATIIRLQGSLTIDGTPAAEGHAVYMDRRVAVSSGSDAVLQIGDSALLRVRGAAELVLVRGSPAVEIELTRGWLLNVIRSGIGYTVKTPRGSAAALGTVFFVNVDSPDTTYICICEGRLRISAPGLEQTLEATHHQSVDLVERNGRPETFPAPMQFHTDEDKPMIGR